jgi:gas vesicle protein
VSKKAKVPIRSIDEKNINSLINEQRASIKENEKIADQWLKRIEKSKDPNEKAFFALSYVEQAHYIHSIIMYISILEWSKNLNRALAEKLQYLDDNTQTIAEKMKIELSTVKKDIENAQLVNDDVHKYMQEVVKRDRERLKKMGESNFDYATRSR